MHGCVHVIDSSKHSIAIYIYIYIYIYICKKGFIHASNFPGITSFISKLSGKNVQSYKYNDRMVLLPNFKAVCPTQTELHSLKVKKLDVCIRPFFANPVTYMYL